MTADSGAAPQRRALVTGASRGIGAAILKRLARAGMDVCGTATSATGTAAIEAMLAETGSGSAQVYDAAKPDASATLAAAVKPIDVLVCNAGITRDGLALRMKDEDWNEVLAVNLSAPFALARACLRDMAKKRWGRIIVVSSIVASYGNPGQANYSAAKAGLEGMVRSLAAEFGSRTITINAVAPGFIATDMTSKLADSDAGKQLLNMIPLRRLGEPDEVASAVEFLASDAASYITGATLPVNGGMLMS